MEGIRVGTREATTVGNALNSSELLLSVWLSYHNNKGCNNCLHISQSYFVKVELVCQWGKKESTYLHCKRIMVTGLTQHWCTKTLNEMNENRTDIIKSNSFVKEKSTTVFPHIQCMPSITNYYFTVISYYIINSMSNKRLNALKG